MTGLQECSWWACVAIMFGCYGDAKLHGARGLCERSEGQGAGGRRSSSRPPARASAWTRRVAVGKMAPQPSGETLEGRGSLAAWAEMKSQTAGKTPRQTPRRARRTTRAPRLALRVTTPRRTPVSRRMRSLRRQAGLRTRGKMAWIRSPALGGRRPGAALFWRGRKPEGRRRPKEAHRLAQMARLRPIDKALHADMRTAKHCLELVELEREQA